MNHTIQCSIHRFIKQAAVFLAMLGEFFCAILYVCGALKKAAIKCIHL